MIGISEHHLVEFASERRSEVALNFCHALDSIVQLQRASSAEHRSNSGCFNDDRVSKGLKFSRDVIPNERLEKDAVAAPTMITLVSQFVVDARSSSSR